MMAEAPARTYFIGIILVHRSLLVLAGLSAVWDSESLMALWT